VRKRECVSIGMGRKEVQEIIAGFAVSLWDRLAGPFACGFAGGNEGPFCAGYVMEA